MIILSKAEQALDKYNEKEDYTYDFEDTRNNIRLTFDHLKIEIKEHAERERQAPWLITLIGFLFAYVPTLLKFAFSNYSGKLDIVFLTIYGMCLIITCVFFFKFIFPRERTQIDSPKEFYEGVANKYKAQGDVDESEMKTLLQESYLERLNECLEGFQKCNQIKAK